MIRFNIMDTFCG